MARIICLEGCSGTGKTTQSRAIHDYLCRENRKYGVVVVNEKLYEPFRTEVLRWHASIDSDGKYTIEQIKRFAKARGEAHRNCIQPLTKQFEWVLFDRSYFTSAVYQCNGGETDQEYIIEENIKEGSIPIEWGFILECDPLVSLERIKERKKKNRCYTLPATQEDVSEIQSYKQLYNTLAERHPELKRVDATPHNPHDVFKQMEPFLCQ